MCMCIVYVCVVVIVKICCVVRMHNVFVYIYASDCLFCIRASIL